ncbi:helix-turn-helix domain-containing protein [Azonexus sp.]|uniref:helix-turn-helix domain-containing protein n=1 Tax=Azonexus sp. TaxID=1872668 RepID=UPI0035AEC7CD
MAFDQFRGRLLSPTTAARETEICVSQLYRWISSGYITATKLGYKMTRIDGDSLADFLTSRMDEPRPPRGKYAKAKIGELAGQA